MHVEGIDVVGPLPPAIQIDHHLLGRPSAPRSTQPDAVRALLDFMTSPEAAEAKRRHGMEPA